MKIIENNFNTRVTCKKCNSIFEYDKNDIEEIRFASEDVNQQQLKNYVEKHYDCDVEFYEQHAILEKVILFVKCPVCGENRFVRQLDHRIDIGLERYLKKIKKYF